MTKKIKVLTLSDHPLSPSGVGIQTRYFIEALLKTGRYKVVSLGGAMKHPNYEPMTVEGYSADEWTIYPVDGYGNHDIIRSVIRTEKPDIVWFMTDPRFWGWLWEIDNEIRSLVPTVYYHVWDNYPYPLFNKPWYDSNDVVATISKVTDDIVRTVSPDVECVHIPHTVDSETFNACTLEERAALRKEHFDFEEGQDKFIFFWNNRNARRKQSGSVMWWFKEFLDEVGEENAMLLMHTDPRDAHGQDLLALMQKLGLNNGQVKISREKLPTPAMADLYNMVDCTLNISDAEGFGLSTFESLTCGTPIIVNMTGGLQEQVTNGEDWFGIGIEPSSKAVIGSQEVPYIYEDRVCKDDFVKALKKMYNLSKEERYTMGMAGRNHVLTNYGREKYEKAWVDLMDNVYENRGSWDNRGQYRAWELKEVA